MEPVTSRDKVAVDPLTVAPRHIRRIALDIVERNISGFPDDLQSPFGCGGDQVFGDFGLAIDSHMFARQRKGIDADQPLAVGQREPFLQHSLAGQPRVDPQPVEQVSRRPFEHSRPDTVSNARLRRAFHDDAVDPLCAKQMAKEESGGPCTDDGDLRFQSCFSSASSTR